MENVGASQRVRIWLCGGLRVDVSDVLVERRLSRRKSRELLAILVDRDEAVSRDELVELLWPESAPGSRAGQLRVLLTELRGCLGPDAIDGRSELRIASGAELWVDVHAGRDELERCRRAVEAGAWATAGDHAVAALDLLDGGFLVGHDGDWVEERRAELEKLVLEALEVLAATSLREPGRQSQGVRAARRLVSRAPFRESGYSLLMRALVAEGNPAEALLAYERLRLLLREELGTVPSVALSALHVWVLEQSDARAAAAVAGDAGDAQPEPVTRYAQRPDGICIAYQVLGDGPVDLVIVPGFMSHLDMQWADPAYRPWLRRLADGLRVITLDKAGTGASDAVAHAQSMEDWAGDVVAVLDAVGSARPVLLGMSEGAAVAVGFAHAHPDRARAVVFYGAIARMLPKEGYLWEHREEILAGMERFAEIELSWGCGGSIEQWAPSVADSAAQRRAWAVFERAAGSPASIARRTEALMATDVSDLLPELTLPVLVTHRRGDRLVSVHHGRHFARVIPGSRYLEFEGDDHIPCLGDSGQLVDAIHGFVAALPRDEARAGAAAVVKRP